MRTVNRWFAEVATVAGRACGSYWAFIVSCAIVIVWLVTGPIFSYSDTWQLVINTGTTVVTFLLLFLVQNTQSRNDAALHLKLDEILRAIPEARTSLAVENLENAPDDVIAAEKAQFEELAREEQAPQQSDR
jgi:low affinity Fe/Cu permease